MNQRDEGAARPPDSGAVGGTDAGSVDGQRLLAGRYRLEKLLGRGSMGAVWQAQDVVLRRSVAVKEVLLPAGQSEEDHQISRERALREARAIAALSHPNVVTLFDVVEDGGRPWVVMELVPARSLAVIIAEEGRLPPVEAARIGLAVLGALDSAHEVGILHRDVKPGNILVSGDGRVKLADFGISRKLDESQITRTGLMVGSPSYIAPEVARGRDAGRAADIWGLGATLHCAVEGSPPFDLGDPVATLTSVVGDPPRPAPHACPLAGILQRCLDKDPRTRIQSAELRAALRAVTDRARGASARPLPAARPAPPPRPAPTPPSRPNPPGPPGTSIRPPATPTGPAGGPHSGSRSAVPSHPASRPSWVLPPQGGASATFGPTATPSPPSHPGTPQPRAASGSGPRPNSVGAPMTGSHFHAPPSAPIGPMTGYPPPEKRGMDRWIRPAIAVLIVLIVVGLAVLLIPKLTGGTTNGSGGSTGAAPDSSAVSSPAPLPPVSSNEATITNGLASGAVLVGDTFRPFAFGIPNNWKVTAAEDDRTEFIRSGSDKNDASLVKIIVVAEPLTADSVDAQITEQRSQIGSPARLSGFKELDYQVSSDESVLWNYTNVSLNGNSRSGILYAFEGADGVLWKIIVLGPASDDEALQQLGTTIRETVQTG